MYCVVLLIIRCWHLGYRRIFLVILSEGTWFQLILRVLVLYCGIPAFTYPEECIERTCNIYFMFHLDVSIFAVKEVLCNANKGPVFFIVGSISASSFSRSMLMYPRYLNLWMKWIHFEFKNWRSSDLFSSLSGCFSLSNVFRKNGYIFDFLCFQHACIIQIAERGWKLKLLPFAFTFSPRSLPL